MPPSFFTLPAEVRNIIYKFLFVSDHPEKLVMPDVNGSRAPIRRRRPDLSNALPLLRTCQYVHEEAASVLYGSNVFTFSDEPYGDDRLKINGFDFEVRWCNFVTMYGFFSHIGSRNRARIRHLRLDFLSNDFIAYPDEFEEGSSRHGGAANCVGDALELLSSNHNLYSFELVFGRKDSVAYLQFLTMFSGMPTRKLVRRIMQLKGVREIKDLHLGNSHLSDGRDDGPLIDRDLKYREFRGEPDMRKLCRNYAYDHFLALRREMEAEDPDKRDAKARAVTYTKSRNNDWENTAYGFQRNPIDQTKCAAEEHDNQ